MACIEFRVRISSLHVQGLPVPCGVSFNFADFKKINAGSASHVNGEADFCGVWDGFRSDFCYETKNLQLLKSRYLEVIAHEEKNEREKVGTAQIDLYSIVTGPTKYELDLTMNVASDFGQNGDDNDGGDRNRNRTVGRVFFDIEMEQICDVGVSITSARVQLFTFIDCFLNYRGSMRNVKSKRTNTVSNNLLPTWQNLDTLWFRCTLNELMKQYIILQLVRVTAHQYFNISEVKIEFLNYLHMLEKNAVPFREVSYIHNQMNLFEGILQFQNIPIVAQLIGGKYTSQNGVINALPFPIPRFLASAIPGFASKGEACLQNQSNTPSYSPDSPAPDISAPIMPNQGVEESDTIRTDTSHINESPVLDDSNLINECITIGSEKLSAEYNSHNEGLICCAQCTKSITQLEQYYFEISVRNTGFLDQITIGLAPRNFPHFIQPGCDDFSYGYRSDTGLKYHKCEMDNGGELYGPTFTVGDIVGCGVNKNTGALYFTKNGEFLGLAYFPVANADNLYPTIALHCKHSKVRVNFGQKPFNFDVSKSDLPSEWKLEYDKLGRVYFTVPGKKATFADPREVQPSWLKYQSQHDQLTQLISKPLKVTCTSTDGGESQGLSTSSQNAASVVRRWKGIKSSRVLFALRSIPRAAFVPEELISSANLGQYIRAQINGSHIDVPSTITCARALDELNLRPGMKFLNVGSGCGYVTVLAGLMIGNKGAAIGVDIDENMVKLAKEKVTSFSKQTGIKLDCVSFNKRNIFLQQHNIGLPSHTRDDYDCIFCELSIERETIKAFESLLKPEGGSVICCIDGVMYLFSFDGTSWTEKALMKVKFLKAKMPTQEEIILEKRARMKGYLLSHRFSVESIDEGMKELGVDDHYKLIEFLSVAHQLKMQNAEITSKEIVDALNTFEYNQESTLLFLSESPKISKEFGLSKKRVKEVLKYTNGNVKTSKFLFMDMKEVEDELYQRLEQYGTGPTILKNQKELKRRIAKALFKTKGNKPQAIHLLLSSLVESK